MPIASPIQRRAALQAALKSTTRGETITIDEMMVIMSMAKGTFVNHRNSIPYFPDASVVGARGRLLYPRKKALEALWKWETRGDVVEKKLDARRKALLGQRDEVAEAVSLPLSEMARASTLMADRDARLVQQRQLIALRDAQITAARVFESVQRLLSRLGAAVDPTGEFSGEIHARLDKAGRDLLLQVHKDMKDMLAPDATDRPSDAGRIGSGPRKPRAPRAPRPSGKRVAKPARHAAAKRADRNNTVGDRK